MTGINTHLVQAGLEQHAKLRAHVPLKGAVIVNGTGKSFTLEIPPCNRETEVIAVW